MNQKIGFIGCGNMGGALLSAVLKTVDGAQITVCDRDESKTAFYAEKFGVRVTDVGVLAKECDVIFLGVKPQMFDGLFAELRPVLSQRPRMPILISMAAGISISAIEHMAVVTCPIIRIMPNMPVAYGEGMILYAANRSVIEAQIADFCEMLSAAGCLDAISEHLIDAASAVSGCGPAFVFLFAEALADGAVACGLPRDKAKLYAAQTLIGAGKTLLESGKHEGALKDAVCSPGGTTIKGVEALEKGSFRASAMEAVIAAYERTLELKK